MDDIQLNESEQKIFDFLKEKYPKDYSIIELADVMDMKRPTVHNHILFLVRIEKIIHSRTVSKTKFYTVHANYVD